MTLKLVSAMAITSISEYQKQYSIVYHKNLFGLVSTVTDLIESV